MQSRFTLYPLLVLAIVVFGSAATAQNVLLPGAPGESSRSVSASEIDTSQLPFTDADIVFMQDMIGHHAQAVEMTDLVEGRTTNPVLLALAHRIAVSQDDEMELMQSWLRARDQDVPEIHPTLPDSDHPHGHHGHESHAHEGMPGMLTSDQMAALAASSGTDFDRMFLEFMIYHHTGALNSLLHRVKIATHPARYTSASSSRTPGQVTTRPGDVSTPTSSRVNRRWFTGRGLHSRMKQSRQPGRRYLP